MAGGATMTGFDELLEALRKLPEALTGEAERIAEGSANATAFDLRAEYGSRRRTGNLQQSVSVEHRTRGGSIVSAVVKVKAPHAHLVEYGSQARHTDIGANRGSMPATPIVGRVASKHRRRMYESMKAMLVRAGALVSGEP
jgi:hypothetical protein